MEAAYNKAESGVRALIEHIGEDVTRDGLLDTPKRVAKAWREMTIGYSQEPADILKTTFTQEDGEAYTGMIVLRNIEFNSLCEHHILPFTGSASIVYIPNEKGGIVGISKLARLVECYARRLQVQERLTMQIANAIEEHLQPLGVGVIVRASHLCMSCRGVQQQNTIMVTSEMRGILRGSEAARYEAMQLMEGK